MAKNDKQREALQKKDKLARELAEFDRVFTPAEELDDETLFEVRPVPRAEVPAPPEPPKTLQNPFGLHDIMTFAEHPYFLDLTLTPMQKVILKSFFAGEQGNQHLRLTEEVTDDCKDCCWNYVREEEIKISKLTLGDGVFRLPVGKVPFENAPCMTCEKFCPIARAARFEQAEMMAQNDFDREEIQSLRNEPLVNRFETERMLLEREKIKPRTRDQIFRKLNKRTFSELILVMGRRSGKSFLVAVIALYVVYKLLKMGHPQKVYNLMDFDIISILNVAKSEDQAKGAIFEKIFSLVVTSPFFEPYIAHHTQTTLHFMTPRDIEEYERRKNMGIDEKKGTIHLISGHSNSSSLVGKTVIYLIIDEMAEMAGPRGDDGKDKELYEKLNKSLATFGLDGKTVCISNPLYEMGEFYRLYESSFERDHVLMFQVPTELCNPTVTKSYLAQKRKDEPESYQMHFEAEFAVSSRDPYLPPELVAAAFDRWPFQQRREFGEPAVPYFAHLDPAYNSDMYALAIVHAEVIPNERDSEHKPAMRVVVDHIHLWKPKDKHSPVNSEEVNAYMVKMAKKFNLVQVSYDHWNSESSIFHLRNHGINAVKKTFSPGYQDHIFQNLKDLFMNERIDFYGVDTNLSTPEGRLDLMEITEARKQFTHLERIIKHNRPKIQTPSGINDDIVDAVAAAAFECLQNRQFNQIARPRAVRTGRIW